MVGPKKMDRKPKVPKSHLGAIRKDFPERLEKIRKKRGLAVSEFAEMLGFTRNAYYLILNRFSGDRVGRQSLSIDTIVRLMTVLNLGFWEIVERSEGAGPKEDPDDVSVGYYRDLITDPDFESGPRLRNVVERAWRAQRAIRRNRKAAKIAEARERLSEPSRPRESDPIPLDENETAGSG